MCLWAVSSPKTRKQDQEYRKYWEHARSQVDWFQVFHSTLTHEHGSGKEKKTPNGEKCMQDHANTNVLLGYGGWDQVK